MKISEIAKKVGYANPHGVAHLVLLAVVGGITYVMGMVFGQASVHINLNALILALGIIVGISGFALLLQYAALSVGNFWRTYKHRKHPPTYC